MGVRPSFSTSAILVRLIPVQHFPVLLFGPFNSSPAFSSPQIWLVHLIPVLHFQSPRLYQALSALSVYNKYTDRFDKRHVTAKVVEPEVKLSLSFNRRVFHADDDDVDTVRVADEPVVHQQVGLVAGKLPETQISSTFTSAAHAIHLYWVSTDRTQTDHDQHCFLFHCILYLFIHRIAVSVTYFIIICF